MFGLGKAAATGQHWQAMAFRCARRASPTTPIPASKVERCRVGLSAAVEAIRPLFTKRESRCTYLSERYWRSEYVVW